MIQQLLLIVGSYALAMTLVHLSYLRFQRNQRKIKHYVLFTHNNQLQVEWYIRSLLFFSWWKSKQLKITVIDQGSVDDTLAIVQRLSVHRFVQINEAQDDRNEEAWMQSPEGEEVITVHLNNQEDLHKLPLLH